MITLFGIPHCDSVKKARQWLSDNDIPYAFHDFKKLGLNPEMLRTWCERVGWEPLVNRKGTTWRKLDTGTQSSVRDSTSAISVMIANPSVIKRPVVQWGDASISVGFSPEIFTSQWEILRKTGAL